MTPLPGVSYETRDASGVSGPPLDTATAFIAGQAKRGPTDRPVFCSTLAAFEAVFGEEVSFGYLFDAAKFFPQEGGAGAWFQRYVGPGAKTSAVKLSDGTTNTAEITADSPGEWGDSLKVTITVGGGNFTATVLYNGVAVETETFATVADWVAWSLHSGYIRVKDLGGADPVAVSEKALTGGTDDRANITDTQRIAALALFTADLGPGQVLCPGATTTAVHSALLQHAETHNRDAELDGADTRTVATHLTECATLRALGHPAECGAPSGPWVTVPGPAPGTTKVLPPSIFEAAKKARRDQETFDSTIGVGNPNSPAAGVFQNAGVSRVATGLSQEAWTDAEREQLNNAGFNVLRVLYGQVVTYGGRTLANPVTNPLNIWLSNRRLDMAILARAEAIGEEFNFRQVDGRGRMLSELKAAIVSRVLMPYWEVGAIFGETPEEAFNVETGDQVNPAEQLAEGLVKAEIEVKRSPLAERVKLIYVKEEI